MSKIHLGVDSTDSQEKGMCTTYVGTSIVEKLLKKGVTFIDYPNLIRLNPNIPYKTRGNGAIAVRIEAPDSQIEAVFEIARETVEELAVFSDPQTNPGIALLTGEIPDSLYKFYQRALHQLLTVREAEETAEKVGACTKGYKNRRGIIGALASIGEQLHHDHTYEIIAYRKEERWGTPRSIDEKTVITMDLTIEEAFFNYDHAEHTMCIAPHSVCPVLAGIRGETAESVKKALSLIDLGEPVDKYVIFRTNQHTNFHLEKASCVAEIAEYSSVVLEGVVVTPPFSIRGGHVFFELESNGRIQCAAFEPTKGFRDTVRRLLPGDKVRVYGGVKRGGTKNVKTINLERLDIIQVKTTEYTNPRCDTCGKSMTSKGKGKGFECKRCKTKKEEKTVQVLERKLTPGVYEPPPSAWRHLYRMTHRTQSACKSQGALIDGWIGTDVLPGFYKEL